MNDHTDNREHKTYLKTRLKKLSHPQKRTEFFNIFKNIINLFNFQNLSDKIKILN